MSEILKEMMKDTKGMKTLTEMDMTTFFSYNGVKAQSNIPSYIIIIN